MAQPAVSVDTEALHHLVPVHPRSKLLKALRRQHLDLAVDALMPDSHCSLLHTAAAHGDLALLQSLLQHQQDVCGEEGVRTALSVRDSRSSTPLMHACASGKEASALLLLTAAHAFPNLPASLISACDADGLNCIHWACLSGLSATCLEALCSPPTHQQLFRCLRQESVQGLTPACAAAKGGHLSALENVLVRQVGLLRDEAVDRLEEEEEEEEGRTGQEEGSPKAAQFRQLPSSSRLARLSSPLARLLREPCKRKGMSLLALAAAEGHADCCQGILDMYATTGESTLDMILDADEDGWTSFTWACASGHVETARVLAWGAPSPLPLLQWKDGSGANVLHWTCASGHREVLQFLTQEVQVRCWEHLQSHGRPALPPSVPQDLSPLPNIRLSLDVSGCSSLLELQEIMLNGQNVDGVSPLHLCCQKGMLSCVQELLSMEVVQVDIGDLDGSTPLMYAAENAVFDVCQALLHKGHANPCVGNRDGETCLHQAVLSVSQQHARGGRALDVVLLLLQSGADPNVQDFEGYTPLHWAVLMNQENMCSILCMGGSSPFVVDIVGDTPLHKACLFRHLACARIIMHHVLVSPFVPCKVHPSLQDPPRVQCTQSARKRRQVEEEDGNTILSSIPLEPSLVHPGVLFLLTLIVQPQEYQSAMFEHRFPKGHLLKNLLVPMLPSLVVLHDMLWKQNMEHKTPLDLCFFQPGKDEWRYHHRLRILFPEPEIPDMPKLQIMSELIQEVTLRSFDSICPLSEGTLYDYHYLLTISRDVQLLFRIDYHNVCPEIEPSTSLVVLPMVSGRKVPTTAASSSGEEWTFSVEDVGDFLEGFTIVALFEGGFKLLHSACASGDLASFLFLVNQVLHLLPPDIKQDVCQSLLLQADENGATCMHFAAASGNVLLLQKLLELSDGEGLMMADHRGVTPLHTACLCGHLEVVKLCCQQRDPSLVELEDAAGRTPLSFAASAGKETIVYLLLKEYGADPNHADHEGLTPLHFACGELHSSCMRILLDFGANPSSTDASGCTPQQHAEEVVEELQSQPTPESSSDEGMQKLEHAKSFLRLLLHRLQVVAASKPGGDTTTPS